VGNQQASTFFYFSATELLGIDINTCLFEKIIYVAEFLVIRTKTCAAGRWQHEIIHVRGIVSLID
jgi:hypothetical protein